MHSDSVKVNSTVNKSCKRKKKDSNDVLRRLFKNPTCRAGIIILSVLMFLAIFSPWIAKYPYDQINPSQAFQGPSRDHIFGTDDFGRDIFSRIIYGGRYSFAVGFFSVAINAIFGIAFGCIAGYYGGKIDNIIMRTMDIIQSFPQILLAIVVASVLGPGLDKCIIALGIAGIPSFSRQMRAQMLTIRGMEYVEAATAINCSTPRIIIRHILPNAISPIIVQISLSTAACILSAAGLSFVGLGVQPPTPEWGAMLSGSRSFIRDYPHMVTFPGVFIMITVLSLNMIGDGLRDSLDPKLKV